MKTEYKYVPNQPIASRAELARLIRAAKGLSFGLHARDEHYTVDASTVLTISAKEALQKLDSGDFDGFVWELAPNFGSVWIRAEAASEAVFLARQREGLVKVNAEEKAHFAKPLPPPSDAFMAQVRADRYGRIAKRDAEIAKIDQRLAEIAAVTPNTDAGKRPLADARKQTGCASKS